MVSGAFVQFSRIHQWAHLIIYRPDYRPDPFMDSPHMAGAVGEPVEPSPPCRPCPRAHPSQDVTFTICRNSVAMSCRRWLVRWRASMAAVYFTRRSSALLHNLLNILSPLRGWATAPYTFTTTDNTPAPCHHGGQGSAIPYTARGLNPRRRFASSRGLIP